MRRLLVLRHGQTAWNLEGRWQGWIDVDLDEVGVAQARRRARQLVRDGLEVVGVASSPLVRALETARIVATELGYDSVRTYPGLRERGGGDWQGLTRDAIEARWPEEFAALRRHEIDAPPNGESTHAMLARLADALAAIDRDMPPGPVLVVTHGGIARSLAVTAGARRAGVLPNVGGMWFDYDGGHVRAGAPLEPLLDDPARDEGTVPVAPEVAASDGAHDEPGPRAN